MNAPQRSPRRNISSAYDGDVMLTLPYPQSKAVVRTGKTMAEVCCFYSSSLVSALLFRSSDVNLPGETL